MGEGVSWGPALVAGALEARNTRKSVNKLHEHRSQRKRRPCFWAQGLAPEALPTGRGLPNPAPEKLLLRPGVWKTCENQWTEKRGYCPGSDSQGPLAGVAQPPRLSPACSTPGQGNASRVGGGPSVNPAKVPAAGIWAQHSAGLRVLPPTLLHSTGPCPGSHGCGLCQP